MQLSIYLNIWKALVNDNFALILGIVNNNIQLEIDACFYDLMFVLSSVLVVTAHKSTTNISRGHNWNV